MFRPHCPSILSPVLLSIFEHVSCISTVEPEHPSGQGEQAPRISADVAIGPREKGGPCPAPVVPSWQSAGEPIAEETNPILL
ncbi:hypothetical protein B0I37DRAFT_362780 [Chaetomium sp. MPI-CAGE-AT-0009]|nr:hypothetical protein B0I37DRAFT_362780 [Chaetomium sp. MPI-CAGE-AT-0009]